MIRASSRRVRFAVLGVAVVAAGAFLGPAAFSGEPPAKFPAAEIHKPSPIPDRVVLTPTTTPATSQNVTWRAVADSGFAQAEILVAPRAFGDVKPPAGAVQNVSASSSTPVNTDLGYPSTYHTVGFSGLTPATRYSYRVGDGVNWSEWHDFTTAAASFQPFSFIYYGDAQNYIDSSVPRVFRQAFAERPQAKAFVHAGDLVNLAESEEEWGQWFQAAGWTDAQINNIATPGNHEYAGGSLSEFWRPQFPFPDNGPGDELLKQTVYYLDYQGVRFISLNSNAQGVPDLMAKQTAWLEGVLKNNPNKWTVVTFHHPVYSNTGTRNNPQVRAQWGSLIEKYGVDLVLQGHDHSYGRGNVKTARKSATVHNGTVYVVSVSGGKMYQLNGGVNWTDNGAEVTSDSENTQLYQLIDVDKDFIRYESRYATGEHHDGFVIRKNKKGERTVNDLRTPENSVGEQVTATPTTVPRKGDLEIAGYRFEPNEKVTISWRRSTLPADKDGEVYDKVRADELGRVLDTFELWSGVRAGTYQIVLRSETQRITTPTITVTDR